MTFIDTDLDAFFGDLAIAVVFGSQTGKGLLDAPGHDLAMNSIGSITAIDYAVTYKTTAFNPAPKPGQNLTVDGTVYIVRDLLPLDDGKLTKAMLKTK